MILRLFGSILLVCFSLCSAFGESSLQAEERLVTAKLRLFANQILLGQRDSITQILPIELSSDRYAIKFKPSTHIIIDSMITAAAKTLYNRSEPQSYLIELEDCLTHEIVHSFVYHSFSEDQMIPCKSRIQGQSCHVLYVSLLDVPNEEPTISLEELQAANKEENSSWPIWLLGVLSSLGLILYMRNRKSAISKEAAHLTTIDKGIAIGGFNLDPIHMRLTSESEDIDLTSKESDLLQLLADTPNETVDREKILKHVWGNDGDYVGRTLDVFISKLRKKLSSDPNVKIVNIRGVGYRLVISES